MEKSFSTNQLESTPEPDSKIGRRRFLGNGIATAGSILLGSLWQVLPAEASGRELKPALTKRLTDEYGFEGQVFASTDSGFEKAATDRIWNQLPCKRRPQLVARVANEKDVERVVRFAAENDLKVSVLGGGHTWCGTALRTSGVLIDLKNLNQVVSIDPDKKLAVVQPVVSNREVQAALKPHKLSYPSGHCPQVKMSGYLLSGGMAWNHGVWGPGVGSVEAIELVTAEGKRITASATENQDYFWAARGSGSAFFGVALRYHLRLYPLPEAITASVYYYPYDKIQEIGRWLGPVARQLPPSVELSLFAVHAPAELQEKTRDNNGKVALVTATMFADSKEEAASTLALLDTCPLIEQCLKKSLVQPMDFEALFDASGALWPEGLRARVDAIFSDQPLEKVFACVQDHFQAASPETVYMFAVFTGPDGAPKTPSDAAFSMTGNLYGGPWTMWRDGADDSKNSAWHNKCMKLLSPHIKGHYVSESDLVHNRDFARASYKVENWQRLAELKKKYDPDQLFFGFSKGLG